jgi:hypothetical protein
MWSRSVAGARIALLVLGVTACKSEEEEVLDRFLLATRRGDGETVAAIAMVAFPEALDDWEVLSVSPERREGYRVPELRRRVEEAEQRRNEQLGAFGDFRRQNYDDLAAIQRRLRDHPETRLTGRLLELQTRWDEFRAERRGVADALEEAERELEGEIRRAAKSLQRESTEEDFSGDTIERDALLRARTGAGERSYRITLTRFEVKNQFGAVVPSLWIVSAVEPEASH